METAIFEQVRQQLKDIIVHDLDANIAMSEIRDDISLYEDGIGLDSISIVNFIVLIERRFSISFGEDDINSQLFSSLNSLAEYIHARVN